MKLLTNIVLAALAALTITSTTFAQTGGTQRPQAPNAKFDGTNNELAPGAALKLNGDLRVGFGATTLSVGIPFSVTATITSAAAATPVILVPESVVGAARKVYVTDIVSKVNGATGWATTATVKLQDTNSSAVDFMTVAVAAMTGNAVIHPSTANVTIENAYALGTGGTAGKGLQLKGNANGTGNNYVVTVTGFIK